MAHQVKIHLVAGARPNFMKVAPLYHSFKKENWTQVSLIFTGQHYSPELSEVFLREFSLPRPDFHLGVGEGSAQDQLEKMVGAYRGILQANPPDMVVVVGDVTSTLAACLAAKQCGVKVAHVEAGLRSRDLSMPEERNRIAVDKVADLLYTPAVQASENLLCEGRESSAIEFVGNIMIDTYCLLKPQIDELISKMQLPWAKKKFALVTLHRASNVDESGRLGEIVESLVQTSRVLPLVFPVHPRTEKKMKEFGLWEKLIEQAKNISVRTPMGYIEFMSWLNLSHCVITDSGGIQEESTYLGIPCFTVRKNSERPQTLTQGSNRLIEPKDMVAVVKQSFEHSIKPGTVPDLWDGKTAYRIVDHMKKYFKA